MFRKVDVRTVVVVLLKERGLCSEIEYEATDEHELHFHMRIV